MMLLHAGSDNRVRGIASSTLFAVLWAFSASMRRARNPDRPGALWIRYGDGLFVMRIADVSRVLDQGIRTVSGRFIGAMDGFGELLSEKLGKNKIIDYSSGEVWLRYLTV